MTRGFSAKWLGYRIGVYCLRGQGGWRVDYLKAKWSFAKYTKTRVAATRSHRCSELSRACEEEWVLIDPDFALSAAAGFWTPHHQKV